MFVREKKKPNGKRSIQIVESYRRGDQVSQKIIRHVGQGASDNEVEALKKLAHCIIVSLYHCGDGKSSSAGASSVFSRKVL